MKWGSGTSSFLGRANLATYVGLVPVGATEQHGPHLPTDTDTRIAAALCDAVTAAVENTIVLPPVAI
jgi:creatinine amidohydrolase